MTPERTKSWDNVGSYVPVLPPRLAVIELLIFSAVIACEVLWDPFPDFNRMSPHPYWLPVLLLSLQYGTVSGLLAAAVAIGGYVLTGLPEPDIGESYFSFLIRAWTQPVLWVVAALLIGAFRVRQIEHRSDLLHEVEDLHNRSTALVDYSNNLKQRCEQLERRLSAAAKPEAARLLEALAQLNAAEPGDWDTRAGRVFDLAFPGATMSVSILDRGHARTVYKHRWAQSARYRMEFSPEEPLISAVFGDGRGLTIQRPADEPLLAGEGLFAAPVFSADWKNVVGMLKIETMPPAGIDGTLLTRLSAVATHLQSRASMFQGNGAVTANTNNGTAALQRLRITNGSRGTAVTSGGAPVVADSLGQTAYEPSQQG